MVYTFYAEILVDHDALVHYVPPLVQRIVRSTSTVEPQGTKV